MTSKVKVNTVETESGSTLTLGKSGDTVTLASGASQSGFGRTGTVDWDTTAKTASFTAVSGNGYFVNTTSGAITATLPAGSAGAIVAFADYANTFDTNQLTISPDGTDKIGGTNANAAISTEGASVTFVYIDSTQGWKQINDATLNTVGTTFISATGGTVTTCGNFKVHTFTGPGTFCVSSISNIPANNEVSYLVVAGGGSGGGSDTSNTSSGGGGAGGYREKKSSIDTYTASPNQGGSAMTITASPFPVTVGSGGAGTTGFNIGNNGSNSVFNSITATGGGGGTTYCEPAANPGGSGGGGGSFANSPSVNLNGGSGNTPPVTPSQGNDGGNGANVPQSGNVAGGGGGGASVAGGNASSGSGGTGGNGVATSITGSSVTRAGGGGGGGNSSGCAGSGGGGAGKALGPGVSGNAGTANTGGGGGGVGSGTSAPAGTGGSGGSGIVVIRYKFQ